MVLSGHTRPHCAFSSGVWCPRRLFLRRQRHHFIDGRPSLLSGRLLLFPSFPSGDFALMGDRFLARLSVRCLAPIVYCGATPPSPVSSIWLGWSGQFNIFLRSSRKGVPCPCLGLVFTSVHISLVGQYSTATSPCSTRSCTKNILFLKCFFLLLLDIRPFFSSRMALLLSW